MQQAQLLEAQNEHQQKDQLQPHTGQPQTATAVHSEKQACQPKAARIHPYISAVQEQKYQYGSRQRHRRDHTEQKRLQF